MPPVVNNNANNGGPQAGNIAVNNNSVPQTANSLDTWSAIDQLIFMCLPPHTPFTSRSLHIYVFTTLHCFLFTSRRFWIPLHSFDLLPTSPRIKVSRSRWCLFLYAKTNIIPGFRDSSNCFQPHRYIVRSCTNYFCHLKKARGLSEQQRSQYRGEGASSK